MRIYHDWEFIDDGRAIAPISVGMVTDDGRELYLVNGNVGVIGQAVRHPWLRQHVVRWLPVKVDQDNDYRWKWDKDHPDYGAVRAIDAMRAEVSAFISATPLPELWAWYGAYDHVCLAQLFGPMSALPPHVPMWTNDLKQEAHRLGDPRIRAAQVGREHHALDDAKTDKLRMDWLAAYERSLGQY